jgi:hypothetical protein
MTAWARLCTGLGLPTALAMGASYRVITFVTVCSLVPEAALERLWPQLSESSARRVRARGGRLPARLVASRFAAFALGYAAVGGAMFAFGGAPAGFAVMPAR